MSLYKRGRIYWCKWEIGGKRVRETTGTTDHKAAQEYHDRRRAELWRETQLGDSRIASWDEATLAWVDEHAERKKSYETDRLRLVWLTERLTGQPITSITTDKLLTLRKELLKERVSATANRYLAVVSAVLHHAHAKGQLIGVPKIPYLPEPKERFNFLTRDQAVALISELPHHLTSMTRFALATGLRRGNVTGLIWENIDMARRIAWIWSDEAKSAKPIAVPLTEAAIAVLGEMKGKDARYVFTYRKKPIFHVTTKAWGAACERAGIVPGFTFHDLRHTWASWHVMGGTPLEVLRQLGGWADMTMVLRYAHLSPGYVAGYAENAALSPATIPATVVLDDPEKPLQVPDYLGWTTGLEPATTGITILKKRRS